MRKVKDHQTKTHMLIILALLTMDVIFLLLTPPAILAHPNAYLKEGACKCVASFAKGPVLVIAIEIVRYCTKMSTNRCEI